MLISFLLTGCVFFGASVLPFAETPLQALLCLISVAISLSIVMHALGATMLALLFVIVYIGAVIILFLFVTMMFNQTLQSDALDLWFYDFSVTHVRLLALLGGCYVLSRHPNIGLGFGANGLLGGLISTSYGNDLNHLSSMYGINSSLFVIIVLILTLAMLGALVLSAANSSPALLRPSTAA